MKLTITFKNFSSNVKAIELIRRAIMRVWKIDIGRSEEDVVFRLEE